MKTPIKKPGKITMSLYINGHIVTLPNCTVTYEWDEHSKSFLTRPTFETQKRIEELNK